MADDTPQRPRRRRPLQAPGGVAGPGRSTPPEAGTPVDDAAGAAAGVAGQEADPTGPSGIPAADEVDATAVMFSSPEEEPDGPRLRPWNPKWWNLSRVTGGAATFPLLILFGLNTVDEFDREAFTILIPNIRDHFNLSIQGVLTLSSLVGLVVLFLEIPLSHLADRYNRIKISVIGASAWGGFSVLTGLAPSVTVLGLARTGAGLGRAVNGSTHNSLLSDWYPADVRPGVYGVHRAANSVGQIIGPLAAGAIALFLGWRAPFLILAVPTFILVLLAMKLKEPVRGNQERRALGADEATIDTEEKPVPFKDAVRILWQVRAMRRTWMALPFVAVAMVGLSPLIQLFYEEEFGLNELQRGFIAAIAEPAQILGVLLGIPIATRLMRRNPALLASFMSVALAGTAISVLILVTAQNLFLAVASQVVLAGSRALLAPGIAAATSLVVPAKVRSLGFSVGNVFLVPALIVPPIIGGFADAWGLRPAMLMLLPILFVGCAIVWSVGKFIPGDIDRAAKTTVAMAEVRRARLDGDPKLLVVRGVDLSYGQTQVLFGVDFDVSDGEIVALLGTNGAGKSTLLKAISGLAPVDAGIVIFDGEDITTVDAIRTAHLGIAQVPGGRGVFPTLTVAENLKVACWMNRRDSDHIKQALEHVLELFPALRRRWNTQGGDLSGGEQQMLSLSQAFIAKPKLLMIDELSLGLAPTIVEKLVGIVKEIHANGTTVILVEQSVHTALRLAERAVFMEKGEVRFSGPTKELLERPDILRSVFLEGAGAGMGVAADGDAAGAGTNGNGNGTDARSAAQVKKAAAVAKREADAHRAALLRQPVVLETSGLTKRYGGVTAVLDVSIQLHDGEILGLIGPNGAGKTTIMDLISGFTPINGGRVLLNGTDVTEMPAHVRAELGLGRSFQDARLWPSLTVRESIAVALERSVDVPSPLAAMFGMPSVQESEKAVGRKVEELIELLALGAFRDKFISELSTGSRRMVEIACILANEPKVLLLDEPSSGIAQKETEALGPVLKELRRYMDGSILVIEHDMPLLTGLADHIVALETGQVVTHGPPLEVIQHPRVVDSYLGGSVLDLPAAEAGDAAAEVEVPSPAPVPTGGSSRGRRRRPVSPRS
jgi:ABC-type branched-subunit amino acid transport system ATPase component/predicted MFS family arabinose efflux permease